MFGQTILSEEALSSRRETITRSGWRTGLWRKATQPRFVLVALALSNPAVPLTDPAELRHRGYRAEQPARTS